MDPEACVARMRDTTNGWDERAEAALDLLCWFAAGGFTPETETRINLIREAEAVIIYYQEEILAAGEPD